MNAIPGQQKITPTKRQQECLAFIIGFMQTQGQAPTFQEIGEAMSISWQSAKKLVDKLEARKHLVIVKGFQRSITLL